VLLLSDIHGRFGLVVRAVEGSDAHDTAIVQLGDFGVGFAPREEDQAALEGLSDYLGARGLHLYAMRGNHDDPSLFSEGSPLNQAHVTLVPDYTVLSIEGLSVLCVGGAVSIDRGARRAYGHGWWEGEPMRWDPGALGRASIAGPLVVATHNCPTACPPFGPNRMVLSYAAADPTLIGDLASERERLDALLRALPVRPRYWFYGHHHSYARTEEGGTVFVGLPEGAVAAVPGEGFPL
jgi:DNA repair exonuclease SbcCD nuclease subunit